MAEVVSGELHLPAFSGASLGVGHHAGIVDEDVERSPPGGDERLNRGLVSEVKRSDVDVPVVGGLDDTVGSLLASLGVAHGDRDIGSG